MNTKETGGSVYPHENHLSHRGMTLRDYFAGEAMKYMGLPTKVSYGRIGNSEWSLQEMETFPYDDMAKVAYKWADAMLKARAE